MSTFSTLRDIFYSGNYAFSGGLESVNEIAFLVDEKYLKLEVVTIANKSEYLTLLDGPEVLKQADIAAGGGLPHIALKILAGKYLKEKRQLSFVYEHPFCGYYPDVTSNDHSIVIECGHTQNSEKTLVYLRHDGVQECIQIPYLHEEDDVITGYCFIPSENLNEFLSFFEKEKRSKLRKSLNKRSGKC